jgi:hypothetical protein
MYVLTGRRRDEFLACPPLVRMGEGTDPPVLMLKTPARTVGEAFTAIRQALGGCASCPNLLYGLRNL